MDRAEGHRAIEPYHATGFNPVRGGGLEQMTVDGFPRLRSDGADRLVQGRLLGKLVYRQSGKGAEGHRVRQIKGQFLIAELPILLQHGTPQNALGGKPSATGRPNLATTQIDCHQVGQGGGFQQL